MIDMNKHATRAVTDVLAYQDFNLELFYCHLRLDLDSTEVSIATSYQVHVSTHVCKDVN